MKTFLVTGALVVLLSKCLWAHDVEADMATATRHLIATLSEEQKAKALFEFDNPERKNWHFIPRPRKGLPMKEMSYDQRLLAQALLATGLSNRGFTKAVSIMSLDSVLADLEKERRGPVRDPELYYVSIFGTPGESKPWGWRVEGHHLSLNVTSDGTDLPSMTPSFFGTNPAEVRVGPHSGWRILAKEEDLGRSLVKSLDENQRKLAILLPTVPKDIFNVPGRNETKPEGISYAQLKEDQRKILLELIHEYLDRHRADVADAEWAKVEKRGLDQVYFTWAGGTEPGEPHYYRVQCGPFILELDNTQGNANHIHSVWRDFEHDFGEDLLKKHYEEEHQVSPAPNTPNP